MDTPFHNQQLWAVILGGSSGFGLATAHRLAAAGMNLCLVFRERKSRLSDIEKELDCMRATGVQVAAFNADALKEAERSRIVDELQALLGTEGRVRMLVHSIAKGNLKPLADSQFQAPSVAELAENAGLSDPESLKNLLASTAEAGAGPRLQTDDFLLTAHAMAISHFEWTRSLLDANLFAPVAGVVALTSEGNQKAWKNYAAVSAAKASLEAISRSMALEFAPHGIRSNVIQPGVTDTPSLRMIPGNETLRTHAVVRNPFKRLTQPEDVANAIYLLTLNDAAWINGALIPVDGGERIC